MIYSKDASFAYPLFANNNHSYRDNGFFIQIQEVVDSQDSYIIKYNLTIESEFISHLIREHQAQLILIIKSKDNSIYYIDIDDTQLVIPKSRISFSEKTNLQVHIQALQDINFYHCNELNDFYQMFKNQIIIPKNNLIGYSNVSSIRNTGKNQIQLFKFATDETSKSDFKVDFDEDSIILIFKNEDFRLEGMVNNINIMNVYFYQGLYRAIFRFIQQNIGITGNVEEESLFLSDVESYELDNLNSVLYDLFETKGVEELSYDTIDDIIQAISPEILDRFNTTIKRLKENGN